MLLIHPPIDCPNQSKRDGIVLVVVIALLALFAGVALSFVFYADAEATAANAGASAQTQNFADMEQELLLSYFLNQFIRGTNNEDSALLGHSLVETMHGPPGGPAFSSTGLLRYDLTHPTTMTVRNNYFLRNYQNYESVDGFKRKPNYYGFTSDPNHKLVAETGVPWTYPDEHNMFVSAVNAAGEILIQSYYRPWLQDPTAPVEWQKYLQLHPHISYHNSFVTPDADGGGHVKNLDWARGVPYWDAATMTKKYYHNDSWWLDLGHPVMTARDGRKYKPLFAANIMELDSKVNLWIAGALRKDPVSGNFVQLTGNQGFGRWEINPAHVLADKAEFNNLFLGNGGVPGRYGPYEDKNNNGVLDPGEDTNGNGTLDLDGKPELPATMPPIPYSMYPWYAKHDFDGDGAKLVLPLVAPEAGGLIMPFPATPAKWDSSNAIELGTGAAPNDYSHPWFYNYFNPFINPMTMTRDYPRPALSNSEAALRLYGKGSTGFTSDLFKLLPNNMGNARTRALTTLLSFDVNRQGVVPFYSHDTTIDSPYQYDPATGWPKLTAPQPYPAMPPAALPAGSEFTAQWRSKLGNMGRVDLHRPLTDYPAPDPATGMIDLTVMANQTAYTSALQDRQFFAQQIYDTLVAVTGAMKATDLVAAGVMKTDPKFQASRWLAQLAANMVDFIDSDDYITRFKWYTVTDPMTGAETDREILFGTELPRLVINEAYAQYDIHALDATKYKLHCWAELHNPFKDTPAGETFPNDAGQAKLKIVDPAMVKPPINAYRLIVSKTNTMLRAPDNFDGHADGDPTNTGAPAMGNNVLSTVDDWGTLANEQKVLPGNGAYAGDSIAPNNNQGFYVVGPRGDLVGDLLFPAGHDPMLPVTYATPKMSPGFTFNACDPNPPFGVGVLPPWEVTYLLQRLTIPHLPPDNNVTVIDPVTMMPVPNPNYNPYITVDYMEKVRVYDGRTAVDFATWASKGRNQPYAAHHSQQKDQDPVTQGVGQPKHTFFRHNAVEDSVAPYPDTVTKPKATPDSGKVQTLKIPFDWLLHLDRKPINVMEILHMSGYRQNEVTQQFVDAASAAHKHNAPWFVQDTLIYRFLEMAASRDLIFGATNITPGKINLNMLFDYEPFLAVCDPQAGNNFTAAQVKSIYDRFVASRTPTVFPDGTRIPAAGDRPLWPWGAGVHPIGPQYPTRGLSLDDTWRRVHDDGTGNLTPLFFLGGSHPYQDYELLTKIYNNVTLRSNCFAVWLTVGFFEVVDEKARPPKLGAEIGRAENRHIRHRMFALVDRTSLFSNPGPQPLYNLRNDTKVVPYFSVID